MGRGSGRGRKEREGEGRAILIIVGRMRPQIAAVTRKPTHKRSIHNNKQVWGAEEKETATKFFSSFFLLHYEHY